MNLFSYVVEHDRGYAPNPFFGFCTLCRCKFRERNKRNRNIVELAKLGDWIIGTGGANRRKSAGRGKLVYAMKVEKKLSRGDYYTSSFDAKKPVPSGSYKRQRGDNEAPKNSFERREQFVLVSRRRFYYFGRNAIRIPRKFIGIEKKGPGFKKFDDAEAARFAQWIMTKKPGIHGQPCQQEVTGRKEERACKSSC